MAVQVKLRPEQEAAVDSVVKAFDEGKDVVVLDAPTGCHPAGTQVLRFDGRLESVENVSAGDSLMGPDSQPRRVLQTIHGRGPIYRVHPTHGVPFDISENHILTLVRTNERSEENARLRRNKNRNGEIVDIPLKEYISKSAHWKWIHKLYSVAVDFPPQAEELPIDPWVLGVILGDGAIGFGVPTVTSASPEIISAVVAYGRSCGVDPRVTAKKGTPAKTVWLTNRRNGKGTPRNPIVGELYYLGLKGATSGNKFIPDQYLVASQSERLELLGGLMDTDGHLGSGFFDYVSKSKMLADGVAFLARSTGLFAVVEPTRKRCQTGAVGDYWRVYISGNVEKIPTRVPRKRAAPRKQKKNALRRGFRLERLPDEDDYHGFVLDGDGRYLLGDLTVTHNSGKSILHAELANRLGVRVFVTTPQISLVNQMLADPRFHALSPEAQIVIGRRNYDCARDPLITTDKAVCYELDGQGKIRTYESGPKKGDKIPCHQKKWSPFTGEEPTCEYYHRKMLAELSPLTVTSLAYFLVGVGPVGPGKLDKDGNPIDPPPPTEPHYGWENGRLSGRDVLMVDEAHGLAEATVSFLTTKFWRLRYETGDWTTRFQEWMDRPNVISLRRGVPWSTETLQAELEQLETLVAYQKLLVDADLSGNSAKDERLIEQDLPKIAGALEDIKAGVPWIARCYEGERWDTFELQPVVAGRHLQRTLWTKARRFILSSGTWIDPLAKLQDMGIEGIPTRLVTMRSTFPPENGPTYLFPVARFTRETRAEALPAIGEMLWKVMRHETGRGVVHTQSYANAKELYALAPNDLVGRLILHGTDSIRNDLISDFQTQAPPGAVLLSPSVTEGLDLPGDRGEWTAFVKCPFPNLGDDRVRKRTDMRGGWRWYEQQAVEKTIQGRGRVIRSATCVASCYLFDEAQIALLKKWWAFLPAWFQESMQVGERRKEQQRLRIEVPREIKEPKGIDFSKLLAKSS